MFTKILISKSLDKLLEALSGKAKERKSNPTNARKEKVEAIAEIKKAVIETRAYMYDSGELGKKDRKRELELARIWQNAGEKIQRVDYPLWEVAEIKALGWSDPREWAKARHKQDGIKLDKILEQCRYLLNEQS